MPTYQYACTACGHRLEAVQSFTDSALTECPDCNGRLRKLFGSVGVVFKGSGFYRTDSRETKASSGETKSESGAASNGTKSESGTSTKSESKSSDSAKTTSSTSSTGGSGSSTTSSTAAVS
ncbi:MAG: FmdB family transcriptional regulator [Kutzneria sp.]|nr:FmdB family transcriptional regulator [Kutzneria sp.]MBV9844322.1 FmdB family transcriptional regulator [Kutzneria sp.]